MLHDQREPLADTHHTVRAGTYTTFSLQRVVVSRSYGLFTWWHNCLATNCPFYKLSSSSSTFNHHCVFQVNHMTPPYGICGRVELPNFDIYTEKACSIQCLSHYVIDECGCQNPEMNVSNVPFCSPFEVHEHSFYQLIWCFFQCLQICLKTERAHIQWVLRREFTGPSPSGGPNTKPISTIWVTK